MYIFMLIIHILVSLFLIFIILLQSGKGEGLSDVFGGGSSQTTIFGSRAGNFLTKATTVCAVLFMVTCLSLTILSRQKETSLMQRELFRQQIDRKMNEGKEAPVQTNASPSDSSAVPAPVTATGAGAADVVTTAPEAAVAPPPVEPAVPPAPSVPAETSETSPGE